MTCQGQATGHEYSSWGAGYVCVNLADPKTMLEVKMALYAASGVRTRTDTAIWTADDEGALRLWASEEFVRDWDVMRDGPVGWMVPSGSGIERLAIAMGYDEGTHRDTFPLIYGAIDSKRSYWLGYLETENPQVGAVPQPSTTTPSEQQPHQPAELPSDLPSAECPSAVIQTPHQTPTQAAAATPSYRNVGVAIAALGIVAAFAWYVRG